jgi:hypothetical protein
MIAKLGESASNVGWLLALLILLITIMLLVVGRIDLQTGLLISGLAVARLI